MSLHVEWFDAAGTSLLIAPAGLAIGEDTIDDGHMALVLDGDSCAVMEGPPALLRERLEFALAALGRMEAAVAAP